MFSKSLENCSGLGAGLSAAAELLLRVLILDGDAVVIVRVGLDGLLDELGGM